MNEMLNTEIHNTIIYDILGKNLVFIYNFNYIGI
jgi:hypothetical protein